MTAPEFQLVNESTMLGYMNFMTEYVMARTGQSDPSLTSFTPDYSAEMTLAYNNAGLVDHLDTKLTGGLLSGAERTEMIAVLATMPKRTDSAANEQLDRSERVYMAVLMMVNSPAYAVVR
jgi:hypothetical protein